MDERAPTSPTIPPKPKPKTSRGEQTRLKLLDAAAREIGRRGFAEASVAGITREAGVAQGTFYVYFHTKEDVLRELVLRMGRRLRHFLTEETSSAPDRMQAERLGLLAFLRFVRANPDLYRVVAESQFVDETIYRRYYEDFAAAYAKVLAASEARGEIRPGDATIRAWALMGIADKIGQRYALWDRDAPLEVVAAAGYDLIAHGLAPDGGGAP
jgi:AcrR family transcriptional regulator